MQILNWLPPHAQQIRYIAPYYDEDEDGNNFIINEGEATDVWHDLIRVVHKTKRPMYYRRRTAELTRRDRRAWQSSIYSQNSWKKEWSNCTHVRIKVIGRRVLFIYDEEFVYKNWISYKNKQKLREKIRKLREGKFKDFSNKIFSKRKESSLDFSMDQIDNMIRDMELRGNFNEN